VQTEVFLEQEEILTNLFSTLKVKPSSQQATDAKLTSRDQEALKRTH